MKTFKFNESQVLGNFSKLLESKKELTKIASVSDTNADKAASSKELAMMLNKLKTISADLRRKGKKQAYQAVVETMSDIAKQYSIKVADLQVGDTSISSDKALSKGDMLKILEECLSIKDDQDKTAEQKLEDLAVKCKQEYEKAKDEGNVEAIKYWRSLFVVIFSILKVKRNELPPLNAKLIDSLYKVAKVAGDDSALNKIAENIFLELGDLLKE